MPTNRQPIACLTFQLELSRITGRPPQPSPQCSTNPITRLQAAELIAASLPPINLGIAGHLIPRFPDIQPLPYNQKDAIRIAYAAGIMFANPTTNQFEPYRTLEPTEASEILSRTRARLQATRPSIPYEIITDPSTAPARVAQVAAATRTRPGGYPVQEPNATYVVISAGEFPTGGYQLQVRDVRQTANRIDIDIELQTPAPGMSTIQVLTYPQLIIKLPKTNLPIHLI